MATCSRLYCRVLNPSKSGKTRQTRRRILVNLGELGLIYDRTQHKITMLKTIMMEIRRSWRHKTKPCWSGQKKTLGFLVFARVATDKRVNIFSFLCFAMKRCPNAANIAGLIGILPYCVLNNFCPICDASLNNHTLYMRNLVPTCTCIMSFPYGKKKIKKKKVCHRTDFGDMTRNRRLFLGPNMFICFCLVEKHRPRNDWKRIPWFEGRTQIPSQMMWTKMTKMMVMIQTILTMMKKRQNQPSKSCRDQR